ncbi:hypothetical protein NMY22_g10831 [Coprinellus aureogranulatus]|nr:hypothetical protein NMY22_g10831 [Coprinellus aureogranulatus]
MALDALTAELHALTTLSSQQVLALGVFASYFGLIGWFFSKVLASIREAGLRGSKGASGGVGGGGKSGTGKKKEGRERGGWEGKVFWALTIASFAHTWYYMFKYMTSSFHFYISNHSELASDASVVQMASWLRDTSLFEEAWYAVCAGKLNWLWSEQLCLFTVGVWTVMLWVEGTKHGVKSVWAYMILGQVVAISVASNLFYVAVLSASRSRSSSPPPSRPSSPPPLPSATPANPSKPNPSRPTSTKTNDTHPPSPHAKRSASARIEEEGEEEDVQAPPSLYVPVLLSLLTAPHLHIRPSRRPPEPVSDARTYRRASLTPLLMPTKPRRVPRLIRAPFMGALERLLPGMNAHVRCEVAFLAGAVGAARFGAGVGFDTEGRGELRYEARGEGG